MTFISLSFALFFGVFFLLYWFVLDRSTKGQNLLLLVGNFTFYAWGGDINFLLLLVASSTINYFVGYAISRAADDRRRNAWLTLGLVLALSSLLYFKYIRSFLPLGLSFYTFKMMSYLLEIRDGRIKATENWLGYFSYISFFPCILAGPIDRPETFLPQLTQRREFNYGQASDGMRRILWGLFKKVVIADNAAAFSSDIFNNYHALPASALWYGAFLATIWIYADFSGYSDIAIGTGALLGFRVTRNFNNPFFAHNIADFWRRWHISLTSWLTDYLFIPLSTRLRDYGKAGIIMATLLTFTIIGLWHGPNLTFLVFGLLNGLYFIPLILRGNRTTRGNAANRFATFLLVMFTMIFFRATGLGQAIGYIRGLFAPSILSRFFIFEKVNTLAMLAAIIIMLSVEWAQRNREHALQIDGIRPFPLRAMVYFTLILIILTFAPTTNADFIYLKF